MLVLQAVATSIDALAIGISFAVLQVQIFTAAGFIGCITFLCCLVGNRLGHRFGLILGTRAEILGRMHPDWDRAEDLFGAYAGALSRRGRLPDVPAGGPFFRL